METKFDLRIYSITEFSLPILQMIAAHNSGKTKINLAVIEAHVMTLKVIGLKECDCFVKDGLMCISEDSKIIMIITEKSFVGALDEEDNITVNEKY